MRCFHAGGWRVIACFRASLLLECPWKKGADDHIVPSETINAVGIIQGRLNGQLDVLLNNAGISPKGEHGGPAEHTRH